MSWDDVRQAWDFSDPSGSEARFVTLRGEADTELQAVIDTQIARARGLQQDFDGAWALLDTIEGSTPELRVRIALERGRSRNSSGQPEASKPYFLDAFEEAMTAGLDALAIDAAHMMGIVENPDQQIVWNERALGLAEASQDPAARGWMGSLYNNLGWTYHDRGEFQQALELFGRAVVLREEQGKQLPTWIAHWCVARTLRSLQRFDEALVIQRRLEAEREAAGQPGAYVFEELGELLLAQGDGEGARLYFARAWEGLRDDPWLAQSQPERLERLRALGQEES